MAPRQRRDTVFYGSSPRQRRHPLLHSWHLTVCHGAVASWGKTKASLLWRTSAARTSRRNDTFECAVREMAGRLLLL
jgi:hypothetical protein